MSKLHRFHVDIFYPDWFEESLKGFIDKLSSKQLVCSYHATKKYDSFSKEYQKVIRDLLSTITINEELNKYIFEFAANDNNEIKKVCYRFPMSGELRCDIIFVVSSTGKLVTIFLNKNFDPHVSLDRSLYEMQ
jgi:hypothetical protein